MHYGLASCFWFYPNLSHFNIHEYFVLILKFIFNLLNTTQNTITYI